MYGRDPIARAAALHLRARRRSMRHTAALAAAIVLLGSAITVWPGISTPPPPRDTTACAPLPTGWVCRVDELGAVLTAHPTAAWDADATRLPDGFEYTVSAGSNTITAARRAALG